MSRIPSLGKQARAILLIFAVVNLAAKVVSGDFGGWCVAMAFVAGFFAASMWWEEQR